MIVVDTNVIVYLLVEGEKTEMAQRTYRRDSAWFIPSLWRHEFLNVLATYVRHGGIEIDEAIDLWQRSTHLFASGEREVDMPHVLRLANQHDISAYDAQYVTLATAMSVPFVTEDQQLLQAFPEIAVSMQEFCES
jgi:predicted nucleic acid-binding protein